MTTSVVITCVYLLGLLITAVAGVIRYASARDTQRNFSSIYKPGTVESAARMVRYSWQWPVILFAWAVRGVRSIWRAAA